MLNQALFIDRTLVTVREAYIGAKVIWKREEGSSPIGEVPSCRLGVMPQAFEKDRLTIILSGGPTKSPFFRERLTEKFRGVEVVAAEDLVPPEIPDPELTGLSMGACYISAGGYAPLYVSRLPARVTLRHTKTGKKVEYLPYEHFVHNFNPAKPFLSARLPPQTGADAEYVLTVAGVDAKALDKKTVDFTLGQGSRNTAQSPQLVIDTLGRIGIDSGGRRWIEMEDLRWQTDRQRNLIQDIFERQKAFELSERARVHRLLTENQFGWQSGHG